MKRFFAAILIASSVLTVKVNAAGPADTERIAPVVDETAILASYIEGADGAGCLSAMISVGAVILNRCRDSRYDGSVTSNGASLGILPDPNPSDMALYAAELAESGVDPTCGAVTFFPESENDQHPGEYVSFAVAGLCFAVR